MDKHHFSAPFNFNRWIEEHAHLLAAGEQPADLAGQRLHGHRGGWA